MQALLALQRGFVLDRGMNEVATWIRQCDEPLFARLLEGHPHVRFANARLGPVDLAAARGLLLTGGADIAAEFHAEPPSDHRLIRNPDPARDAWEFAAVRFAFARGLPILGICKGVQVLNVALGGTLLADISGHDLPGMKSANVQPLRYATGVRHRFEKVNSSHHQALNRVADALEIEAWHAGDGIIEQVRIRDYPWGIGVQYHPECDAAYADLFEDFFSQFAH